MDKDKQLLWVLTGVVVLSIVFYIISIFVTT